MEDIYQQVPTGYCIHVVTSGAGIPSEARIKMDMSFICDGATYDQFQRTLTMTKAQVVNGGQTIRAIHRAHRKGTLKED